jgi:uncharacterized protein YaaN involved in tellurite resistance
LDVIKAEIDFDDITSVISYGAKAQKDLNRVSENMIAKVRNKDVGGVIGEQLNEMTLAIRGFKLDDLQNGKKPGFLSKLFGALSPLAKAIQRYETLENQISAISMNLEKNISVLMKDSVMFETLFDSTVEAYESVKLYVRAAEELLDDLDNRMIPEAQSTAKEKQSLDTQRLMDLQNFRMRIERKINTLKKSQLITFTSLPRIRTLQDANVNAIEQTKETINTAIPAWKQQFAMLVAARRTEKAARDLQNAADLTNSIIAETAQVTKDATLAVQSQLERGIFDLEAIEKSKNLMIETLREKAAMYKEAEQRRLEESRKLEEFENELRVAMTTLIEDASLE